MHALKMAFENAFLTLHKAVSDSAAQEQYVFKFFLYYFTLLILISIHNHTVLSTLISNKIS